jgi:flagellar biosynthesis component FlhA
MSTLTLSDLKTLNIDQYEQAKAKAVALVAGRIGERPERKHFTRELGSSFTALDGLAIVVFLAALAISSLHIIQFMGMQAAAAYHDNAAEGIVITANGYTVIHQIGAILLAESAALLFMTQHSMSRSSRLLRHPWVRWFSVPLVLALLAALFVFYANLSSGVNAIVGVMPPLFTLGIAFRLEHLIAESLSRRESVTSRYLERLQVWEAASADPTAHADYRTLLMQTVWQALAALPSNRDFRDAPASFKKAAVLREMEREQWTESGIIPEVEFIRPTLPALKPGKSGTNSVRALDGDDFMPATPSANGRTAAAALLDDK